LFSLNYCHSQQSKGLENKITDSTNYSGVYSSRSGVDWDEIIIKDDGRFKSSYWVDVGGYIDSTIGYWRKTEFPGVIKLYSDKLPIPAKTSTDTSFKGLKIILHSDDPFELEMAKEFSSIGITTADTTIYLKIDSTCSVTWTQNTPIIIGVGALGCFSVVHILDSNEYSKKVELAKRIYRNNPIVSYAPPTNNIITMKLQKDFYYLNGHTYFVYNDVIYSLYFGEKKIIDSTNLYKDISDKIIGKYRYDDKSGILTIDSDHRFKKIWSNSNANQLDSTVGKWKKTSTSDIIELFSDRVPKRPLIKTDSKIKGFKIKFKSNRSWEYEFVDVKLYYNDTILSVHPDSNGTILCKKTGLQMFKATSSFNFAIFYFVDSLSSSNEIKRIIRDWRKEAIIACGTRFDNSIEIELQDSFEYFNGDKFLYYDGCFHSLHGGSEKIIQ
jgi:hypothetical protein